MSNLTAHRNAKSMNFWCSFFLSLFESFEAHKGRRKKSNNNNVD